MPVSFPKTWLTFGVAPEAVGQSAKSHKAIRIFAWMDLFIFPASPYDLVVP